METLELFYPRITAQAGSYTFQQGIEIEVSSARDSRMDWAKIRFTDRFRPEVTLSRLEPATILLGYGGAFDEVFTGYVAKPYSAGSNANEIVLKDAMMLLEDITVNETFLDTTPQEVIRYILAQAGLTELKLTSMVYPARKRLSIRKQSGVQALDAVAAVGPSGPVLLLRRHFLLGQATGADPHLFFRGGTKYPEPRPARQPLGPRNRVRALCPPLPPRPGQPSQYLGRGGGGPGPAPHQR